MIECFIVVKDIQVDEGQTRYKKYARYENLCLTDGMAGTVSFVSVTWLHKVLQFTFCFLVGPTRRNLVLIITIVCIVSMSFFCFRVWDSKEFVIVKCCA